MTELAGSGIIGPKPGDATRTGGTLGHLQDPVSGPEQLLLSADTPATLGSQDASEKSVGAWAESHGLKIKMRKGHHLSSLEKRDAHYAANVSSIHLCAQSYSNIRQRCCGMTTHSASCSLHPIVLTTLRLYELSQHASYRFGVRSVGTLKG